jgi:hypothetical protein
MLNWCMLHSAMFGAMPVRGIEQVPQPTDPTQGKDRQHEPGDPPVRVERADLGLGAH